VEAIYEGCLVRFRDHDDYMAALLGAVPIALGYGAGGEARRPLGLAVLGLDAFQLVTYIDAGGVYVYGVVLEKWNSGTRPYSNRNHVFGLGDDFSETFIRRPIATSLLMAAIALFGVVAYRALPVSDLPNSISLRCW